MKNFEKCTNNYRTKRSSGWRTAYIVLHNHEKGYICSSCTASSSASVLKLWIVRFFADIMLILNFTKILQLNLLIISQIKMCKILKKFLKIVWLIGIFLLKYPYNSVGNIMLAFIFLRLTSAFSLEEDSFITVPFDTI